MRASQSTNVGGGRRKKLTRDPGLRLAYLLARNGRWKSGHEVLEELTPSEFAYWQAAFRLDPWGGEYDRHSQSTTLLLNAIRILETVMGGRKIDNDSLLELDALVPHRKPRKTASPEIRQSLETLESTVGLPT